MEYSPCRVASCLCLLWHCGCSTECISGIWMSTEADAHPFKLGTSQRLIAE
jgi:hypothetical protein